MCVSNMQMPEFECAKSLTKDIYPVVISCVFAFSFHPLRCEWNWQKWAMSKTSTFGALGVDLCTLVLHPLFRKDEKKMIDIFGSRIWRWVKLCQKKKWYGWATGGKVYYGLCKGFSRSIINVRYTPHKWAYFMVRTKNQYLNNVMCGAEQYHEQFVFFRCPSSARPIIQVLSCL